MSHSALIRFALVGIALALLGLRSASVQSDPTFTYGAPPAIAQDPLYMQDAVPPLNMLVMGKDHKIYYEAYNDASDLNGDGILDVGYRGYDLKDEAPTDGSSRFKIDYYGYFNSYACYSFSGDRFVPVNANPAGNKTCGGLYWSGDFLNYLTMSRMDTLRRVLYGGWRRQDTATDTTLQGAYFPQDAHSWGKEYQSFDRDKYNIRDYTPLSAPAANRYHLFAVTTTSGNGNTYPGYEAPLFRVLQNTPYRVWNWLSIEGPVAGNRCFNTSNQRVSCVTSTTLPYPGTPGTEAAFDALETTYGVNAYLHGSGPLNARYGGTGINCYEPTYGCNPFSADVDQYLTVIDGELRINGGLNVAGNYQFAVDGDDAVDVEIFSGSTLLGRAEYLGDHDWCDANRTDAAYCTTYATGNINLGGLTTREYAIKFRHVENGGGSGYRLLWRKTSGSNQFGWQIVPFHNSGNANGGLRTGSSTRLSVYDLTPTSAGSGSLTDYRVRVQACPATAALRDSTCRVYPNGGSKPTGILHDYGESQRMYFGLITGSQRNNLEGGVLRRNIGNFASEINADTGVFNDSDGIVRSIDRLRMIGGNYNGSVTDNTSGDTNWSWGNGSGNCPTPEISTPLANGDCRMWGNPIAEMLYESLRYFAGAKEPIPRFVTGGNTAGNEDVTLGLPAPEWTDPYGSDEDDQNYPSCAKPYQTIISDINPSYDGDLPGSDFAGAITSAGFTPDRISGFDAGNEGQTVWTAEGLGTRSVFIGEVNGATDGAPTPKSATTFGNIRGLSPEEPTKAGTYYSASVARFGRENDISAAPSQQRMSTYSIALASPLPKIEFPVDGRTLTLLPFAKTVSGTFGQGERKPTNTIVDFYVEEYANFDAGTCNSAINGCRPRAVFRINYEDVEQGNDHDMDAIVRYEVVANANSTVSVNLRSEYAAGSANHAIGYTMSGTTQDGIYLEVCDLVNATSNDGTRASCAHQSYYRFNTPPGRAPGYCDRAGAPAECNGLPSAANRVFTPSTSTSARAFQLRDPLWYAAKYGSPDPDNWDSIVANEPDNYFLVQNPLNLREQLQRAFDDIEDRGLDVGNRSVSGARVQSGSFTLEPSFARNRQAKDWIGELKAVSIYPDGSLGPDVWSARTKLGAAAHGSRNIRTITNANTNARARFRDDDPALGSSAATRLANIGITNAASVPSLYGRSYSSAELINYLRGDQSLEASREAGGTLRQRSAVLGDIVNSEPVIYSPRSDFGYAGYGDSMFDGYADTGSSGYLREKRSRIPVVYVGANDGMLHAFDASTVACTDPGRGARACTTATSGDELFAFIPNGILKDMARLGLPDERYHHSYYVDGQIAIGDARDDADRWHTLLVGSTGAGGADPSAPVAGLGDAKGRSVFALDVTDIQTNASFTNANILWERNSTVDNDIGHIYGKPLLVPLENNDWGVLFGNGYGGNRSDPSLYILDAFDGSVIKKITGNDGSPAQTVINIPIVGEVLGAICNLVSVIIPLDCRAVNTAPYNGLGQITAIDRDGNGKVDTVYGGDLQGNLWKFDLRAGDEGAWDVYQFSNGQRAPLLTAQTGTERQPITGGIRVSAGPGSGVMVYFGTGRYFVQGDNEVGSDPQVQRLYGIFDNAPVTGNANALPVGSLDNLVAQSITGQEVVEVEEGPDGSEVTLTYTIRNISQNRVRYFGATAKRGWYLDLKLGTNPDGSGERFIASPRIQAGRVFFTTYEPAENGDGCSPGGTNWQYGLDLLSGAGSLSNVSLLGRENPACTGGDCGGVAVQGEDGSTTLPPIMNTSMIATRPTMLAPTVPACDPAIDPSCPTFEQCQVVIYPGAFVLPRPCGRQSWRQLK